jgi:hypothetical protein
MDGLFSVLTLVAFDGKREAEETDKYCPCCAYELAAGERESGAVWG